MAATLTECTELLLQQSMDQESDKWSSLWRHENGSFLVGTFETVSSWSSAVSNGRRAGYCLWRQQAECGWPKKSVKLFATEHWNFRFHKRLKIFLTARTEEEFLTLWRLTAHYTGRTALLASKRCILYIYSTNIGTEYFKHGIYSSFVSLQNAVCFKILTYLVPVLFTFYIFIQQI